jgi:hypothetical protein
VRAEAGVAEAARTAEKITNAASCSDRRSSDTTILNLFFEPPFADVDVDSPLFPAGSTTADSGLPVKRPGVTKTRRLVVKRQRHEA